MTSERISSIRKKELLAWAVWSVASLYFLYDFMQQVAPSVMSAPIAQSFRLDAVRIGVLTGIYFWVYGLLQVPIGMLIDRFGPRRPLALAAIVCGVSNLAFAHVHNEVLAIILRALIGAGAGFSFVTVLKVVSNWFPARYFATLTGITNIVGMLGAIFAEGPLNLLVKAHGWRGTSELFGVVGLILSVLIYAVIRDFPPGAKSWSARTGQKRDWKKTGADLKFLIKSPDSWINGFYAMLINVTYVGFADLWGLRYLQQYYGITSDKAGFMISLFYVATIPGGVFFGWLSDVMRLRKPALILAASLGVVAMPLITYLSNVPISVMGILIFMLGFAGSGNVVCYAVAHDLRPPGSAGTSIGFVNTFLIGGSALFQPVIGLALEWSASIRTARGVYALADYKLALSIIVVALVLTLLLGLVLRETHSKATYQVR